MIPAKKLYLAIGAAMMVGALGSAGAAMAPSSDAAQAPDVMASEEALPDLVVSRLPWEADEVADSIIGRAFATLSLRDGVLWFSAVGAGYNPPNGEVMAATDTPPPIIRSAGGDIDLTGFPPGDVQITVQIDDSVYAGGYRIPSDPWQAVALAIDPPGAPEAPDPVFGQSNWPASFETPTVAADQRSVTWIDTETDQNVYEYALALDGPNGRIVIDPKIRPGGSTNR